jgi:protein-tyrosine phosphatase
MREVLFICTGNYYRSRLAEAVFNHGAVARGLAWRAFSRGLATHLVDGAGSISLHTRFALLARGIPLDRTGAKPMPLRQEDLERATRIIALKEAEHRALIRAQFPEWEDRVEYWHMHDIDVGAPDVVVPEIERAVLGLLDEIAIPGASEQAPPRSP